MTKEWARGRVIDRSQWKSGPWDNEPDFYEWITESGYEAYCGRLPTGTWYGYVIAPHPDGIEFSKYMHYLHWDLKHQVGMVVKTDIKNVGEFGVSFEHNEAPGPTNRTFYRGPYRTLDDMKKDLEALAKDILLLNNDSSIYQNVFEPPVKV